MRLFLDGFISEKKKRVKYCNMYFISIDGK